MQNNRYKGKFIADGELNFSPYKELPEAERRQRYPCLGLRYAPFAQWQCNMQILRNIRKAKKLCNTRLQLIRRVPEGLKIWRQSNELRPEWTQSGQLWTTAYPIQSKSFKGACTEISGGTDWETRLKIWLKRQWSSRICVFSETSPSPAIERRHR